MKKLPEVNVSFDNLYGILIAPIRHKMLMTGIELKVFNHLSEPSSAQSVAGAIGGHLVNTRLFLDGLAASGLIMKKDGLYQNTPVTQTFMVEGSQTYLGQHLSIQNQFWAPLENLANLVKEGPPSTPEDMSSGEMWEQIAVAMANYERAGMAQQAIEIVSVLPEFSSIKKMLDLGGGPGMVGIAIVGSHPTMKGVIFDQPPVAKVAENFIKEYEMEARMEVMGGNYMIDSIGGEYDLVWASFTLNFARHDMDTFMKKIYDALNPGGVFISSAEGLTHERTKPEIMVLGMSSISLMGQDMCFDQGFIADAMTRIGFKSIHSCTLDTPVGPVDIDIGRKGGKL